MPPRSIMYHFTPATCCIDLEGEVHQKRKRKKGEKKGGGGTNVEKSNFVHTVLAAIQQVQFLFKFI